MVHAAIFARADTTLGPATLTPFARALGRSVARLENASPEAIAARLPAAAVGSPEDFAARLAGAREIFLRDGRVSVEMLSASLALVRARSPIPEKVKIPRQLNTLLLTVPPGDEPPAR